LQRTIPAGSPTRNWQHKASQEEPETDFILDAQEQVTAAKYHSDSILHTYSIINRGHLFQSSVAADVTRLNLKKT